MLAPGIHRRPQEHEHVSASQCLLPTELNFYQAYAWCLNPNLTVREAIDYLRGEIGRLEIVPVGWQRSEVATNVFLLSCALMNAFDEYLGGPTLHLPRQLAARRLGRDARWVTEIRSDLQQRRRAHARRWKQQWQAGFDEFLAIVVAEDAFDSTSLATRLPPDLQAEPIAIPSAFRRLDLNGQNFVTRFPNRFQPILLLGLRTAGSYFAPLLRAFLKAEACWTVSSLTVQPNKGPGRWEGRELGRYAQRGYMVVILDDPPYTGGTIDLAFDIARRAGFAASKLKALIPTHLARRSWAKSLPNEVVVVGA